MGHDLRRWLRAALPADVTPAERLVALEIADNAKDETRRAWPTLEQLAHWCGLKNAKSVGQALRGLADKGWEMRVPIAKEEDGTLVFARAGQKLTFLVPEGEGVRSRASSPKRTPKQVRHSTDLEVRQRTDLGDPGPLLNGPEVRQATPIGPSANGPEVRQATDPSPQSSPQLSSKLPSVARADARNGDGGDFWAHVQKQAEPQGRTRVPVQQPRQGPRACAYQDDGYGSCARCYLPRANQIHRGAA